MSELKPMFLFGSGIGPAPSVSLPTSRILGANLHRTNRDAWVHEDQGNAALGQNPYDDPEEIRKLLRKISANF